MSDEETDEIDAPRRPSELPPEHASPSRLSVHPVSSGFDSQGINTAPPVKQTSAISSSPLEISALVSPPGSVPPPAAATSSFPPPPSAMVDPTLWRGQRGLPLKTILAIGAGVFVVLVALTMLLFR